MIRFKRTIGTVAGALLIAAIASTTALAASDASRPASKAAASKPAQLSFATPDAAAAALADAVRAEDVQALLAVIGPDAGSWLSSGDAVADRADWRRFLAAYDRKHSIDKDADRQTVLLVGDDDWPFPAPLVRQGERWVFDAEAGREEIISRRIGRNELDTIQTLLAIVDAQRDYAVGDLDGNGYHDYARRFVSRKGSKDGLFWPVADGQPPSPLGTLIAGASSEGYTAAKPKGGKPTPYHGYLYRMLTGEGRYAPDGAYDYLVGDTMIGGFAVVAYPARYGVSGVMTFIVNHSGVVYQKDLGDATAATASRMKRYDPDASWTIAH